MTAFGHLTASRSIFAHDAHHAMGHDNQGTPRRGMTPINIEDRLFNAGGGSIGDAAGRAVRENHGGHDFRGIKFGEENRRHRATGDQCRRKQQEGDRKADRHQRIAGAEANHRLVDNPDKGIEHKIGAAIKPDGER